MKLRLYKLKAMTAAAHKPLPPLVCHPGAKHFSKHLVIERIPEHSVYVEPFFGGGSVFFAKPSSQKEVISDQDKGLMGFYKKLDCRKLTRCVQSMIALGKNPEKIRPYWRRHADKLASGSSDSCNVWIGKSLGYGCKSAKPSFSPKSAEVHAGKSKILGGKCERYKERLTQATILSGDYQKVVNRYDSKKTFFYLDPPWLGVSNQGANRSMYHGENTTSPESVCAFLRRIKGKFLLHYDDNPRIRKACKGFYIERVPWRSGMQGGSERKTALLISNYRTPKRRTR